MQLSVSHIFLQIHLLVERVKRGERIWKSAQSQTKEYVNKMYGGVSCYAIFVVIYIGKDM